MGNDADRRFSFSLVPEEEFAEELRAHTQSSEWPFDEKEVEAFLELAHKFDAFSNPWILTRFTRKRGKNDVHEHQQFESALHVFRLLALERLMRELSQFANRTIDVLCYEPYVEFLGYYDSLSDSCQKSLDVAIWSRKERVLLLDFGIRHPGSFSRSMIDSKLRKIKSARDRLLFLTGFQWWESTPEGKSAAPILTDAHQRTADALWQRLEDADEVRRVLEADEGYFLHAIPEEERFNALRDFLKDLDVRNGKYVWTHSVQDLAFLIHEFFRKHDPLIREIPDRFKRATDWFVQSKKSMRAESLRSSATRVKNGTNGASPSAEIQRLYDSIVEASQQ